MIRLHFGLGPNPEKVVLLLEELGAPYEIVPVDTYRGAQHQAEFRALNPNAKVPALEDGDARLFDSTAILLHLAETHERFLGAPEDRPQLLSWLMFVATGLGPYSGQAVHFQRVAPEPKDYAVNRYRREVERHYRVLDERLEGRDWIVGRDYTIADISGWAWINRAQFALGEGALAPFANLRRWMTAIEARPAFARAKARMAGVELKRDFDEETARALFPQNFPA